MTNPTNARQELLEKDFFSLLEGRGLQKPVGPIGHEWLNKQERELRHLKAYQEFEKIASQEELRLVKEELKKNQTGYEHVVEPFKNTQYSPLLDLIYFGEYPTDFFNAQSRRTENGYLCLLNRGMRRFLYSTAMAAFYSIVDDDIPDPEASEPRGRSIRDVTRFGYAAMNCWRFIRGFSERTQFEGQHHTHTTMIWGAGSFGAIRDFVVAHEVAHIALGHLDNSPIHMINTPLGELEVINNNHSQEYEADQLAQDMLFELARTQGFGTLSGGICFMAVNRILSTFRWAVLGTPMPDAATHPTAEDRFEALFQNLKRRLSQQALARVINIAAPYESLRMAMEFVEIKEGSIYFPVDRFRQHLDTLKTEL
jgi:hypothetical protein